MKKYGRNKTARLSGWATPEFLDFLREQARRFAVSQSVLIEVAVRHFATSGAWTTCRNCGGDNLKERSKNSAECVHCGVNSFPFLVGEGPDDTSND